MAIGRITGPLLKANLLRDGVDLAFETDLLYLDIVNGRIGIHTASPDYDLDVNGTTRTTNLQATTQATIGTTDVFTISGNTIASSNDVINLTPSGINPVVYQAKLTLGDLQIANNTIQVTTTDTDLEINTLGTGEVNVNSNMYVTGDLHVTGTITADGDVGGTITLGDSNTDNVVFNADINSNIIPDDDSTWDLGSDPTTGGKAWRNAYATTVTTTNITVDDLTVNTDLEVVGTSTFQGDVTFGNATSDTVNFVGRIASDLIPATTSFYDLGASDAQWSNGFFSRIEVDNLAIDSNGLTTTGGNQDLYLTADGTGRIYIPTNDVQIDQNLTVTQDLTVTTGTTYLKNTTIVGDIDQTGNINQTGDFTTSGNTEVTGNITASGYVQLPNILISGNTVSTRTAGTDLQLTANGTGDVVFEGLKVTDNNIQSTATNANITLTPQGTGNVVISSNQALVLPVGTDAQRPATPTNGMVRYNTDRNRYEGYNNGYWLQLGGVISEDGSTRVLAEATPGANDNVIYFYADDTLTAYIDSTKLFAEKFQTNNITIENDTISASTADTDINLTTSGTGSVKIGNFAIRNNTITNTVSNSITELAETGDGYVKIAGTNGVVIPSGDLSTLPPVTETGMIRFNTFYSYVEVYNGTTWVNVAGTSSGISSAQATELGIVTALLFG